jgi:hypothetical protein
MFKYVKCVIIRITCHYNVCLITAIYSTNRSNTQCSGMNLITFLRNSYCPKVTNDSIDDVKVSDIDMNIYIILSRHCNLHLSMRTFNTIQGNVQYWGGNLIM